jgi:hypothetical protein
MSEQQEQKEPVIEAKRLLAAWSSEGEVSEAELFSMLLDDDYSDITARFWAAAPRILRALLTEHASLTRDHERLKEREAECHDLLTEFMRFLDADNPVFDATLARVNQVLGANDPEGRCGNPICHELSTLQQSNAALLTALRALRDEMWDRAQKQDDHGLTYRVSDWSDRIDELTQPAPETIRCRYSHPGDDPTCPVDHDQISHERGTV